MSDAYTTIADTVSLVRNARFGEIVRYLDGLIESGVWTDFTPPSGYRFVFHEHEFDYFLIAMELDVTTVRYAYIQARDVPDLPRRQMRLADITGKGVKTTPEQRRSIKDAIAAFSGDPSGTAARLKAWRERTEPVVTDATARIAKDPERRSALEAGEKIQRQKEWVFRARTRELPTVDEQARLIAAELAKNPDLEQAVLKILRANYDRNRRSDDVRAAAMSACTD